MKIKIIAAGIVLAAILAFYFFADPSMGLWPRCTFKTLTGYDCPGCGFQRALHALLHGHVSQAWHFNPFAFFAVPVAAYYIVVESCRKRWPRLYNISVNPWIISAILLATILFWILRN